MSLTNQEAAEQLYMTQDQDLSDQKHSIFQNETTFKAKVLSGPAPYSGPATVSFESQALSDTGLDSKYLFTARISDERMTHKKFLEDPCDQSVSPTPADGSELYALHTKVRLTKAGAHPQFQPGDIVEVRLPPGSCENLYNIEFAEMTQISDVFQNQRISNAGACASLGNLFRPGSATGGTVGGSVPTAGSGSAGSGSAGSGSAASDDGCEEGYRWFEGGDSSEKGCYPENTFKCNAGEKYYEATDEYDAGCYKGDTWMSEGRDV